MFGQWCAGSANIHAKLAPARLSVYHVWTVCESAIHVQQLTSALSANFCFILKSMVFVKVVAPHAHHALTELTSV